MMQLTKETIQHAYDQVTSRDSLLEVHETYCGKTGFITQENKTLASLSAEEKKIKGQEIQILRTAAMQAFESKNAQLLEQEYEVIMAKSLIDASIVDVQIPRGHMHLLQKERRRMEDIMAGLGFMIYYGDDVVTKEENFYSVNIPHNHPATEMHDTLFLYQKDATGEEKVLRTQTSAMQNRMLKTYGAPLRVAIPGKVYRYESLDASHDTVFRQLEGLVVDKGLSISHLKHILKEFLSAVLETAVDIRLRPAYFPFVEPGFEIDASCPVCKQEGCSLCKQTGWIEILGAGMVHPHVLTAGGIDPQEFSGFAFGIGVTRLVAIKYGIKDIRYFTNGDLRFLQTVDGR